MSSNWKSTTDIYKSGYWINGEGDFIHFTKISKRYASNIYNFLLKIGKKKISNAIVTAYSAPLLGEMAEVALNSEIDYYENYADPMDYVRNHPFYSFLIDLLEQD